MGLSNAAVTVTALTNTVGARVEGVDLRAGLRSGRQDKIVGTLQMLLLEHHVIFLPGQHLDDVAHRALAHAWGEPHPHPVAAHMGSSEVLASVENDADRPPQEQTTDSGWHADYTFHSHIADAAMLRSEVCPPHGGATMWASTHAAYDNLPEELKEKIAGLSAHHDLGPKFAFEMERSYGPEIAEQIVAAFPGAEHPVVATHPVTMRPLLFVNPGYTRHIVGLSDTESRTLLDTLFTHLSRPESTCRYEWEPGDLAIWDEHATVHHGPSDFAPHHRLLRRCTVGNRQPQASTP